MGEEAKTDCEYLHELGSENDESIQRTGGRQQNRLCVWSLIRSLIRIRDYTHKV